MDEILQKYLENKDKKSYDGQPITTLLVTLNTVAVSKAVFNPETGERLDDVVIQVFPDQLKVRKENLLSTISDSQAEIAKIDEILADIATAKV